MKGRGVLDVAHYDEAAYVSVSIRRPQPRRRRESLTAAMAVFNQGADSRLEMGDVNNNLFGHGKFSPSTLIHTSSQCSFATDHDSFNLTARGTPRHISAHTRRRDAALQDRARCPVCLTPGASGCIASVERRRRKSRSLPRCPLLILCFSSIHDQRRAKGEQTCSLCNSYLTL